MQDSTLTQNKLCHAALRAEEANRLDEAAALYQQAIKCGPGNPTPYLFFGYALQLLGKDDAAAQVWSLGADLDALFINAWQTEGADEHVKRRSKSANDSIRKHFTSLHQKCMTEFRQANPQANIDRIAAAVWCQTHDSAFEYSNPEQKPHLFLVPDLPPIPIYDHSQAPWSEALESAWPRIKAEYVAAQEAAAEEQAPYLGANAAGLGDAWEPLADSLNWGSFHLYKMGEPNQRLIDLFPETLKALGDVPLIRTTDGPSEILFSVLQGEQRIPPHFGVANTDMTVHLPIIVTPDSAIRVVDTVYEWQQGKVFAFDDAFRHESWNNATEARVNLLFEAWHPDLTKVEQDAISATFAARVRWNQARSIEF